MSRSRYTFAIALLCGLALARTAYAGINFVGAEITNVAPKPEYMVSGDINNDDKADVIVISPSSKEVDVYLAADTQTFFAPAQSIHFGNTLRGPVLGDLNGDDRLDLVVADQSSDAVWILLGRGDGTFLTPYLVDVEASRAPTSVAVGNFDDEGNMDLAVADARVDRVFILLNDNGTPPRFRRGGEIEAGLQPETVLAADLNRDDHPDLITLNTGGPRVKDVSVIIWKRAAQGFPEFEAPQKYTVGEKPENLILGDFNDDGAPDVAMLNRPAGGGNSQVNTLVNQGNGVLFPPNLMDVPCPFFTGGQPCKALAMTLGDFDGNGDVDLMVAMADPRRSRGSASSLADAMQAFGGRGDGTFVPGGVFATRKAPVSMAAGDFTGDDKIDIAVANQRTLDVQAFINTSSAGGGQNADPCLLGEECLSSRCINGVCCAAACAVGERCNVPGREGICVPIPPTPVPCTLPEPAPECVEGQFCVDDFCCDQECPGGRCDVPGFIGVCVPGIEPGFPCEGDGEACTTGICVNEICCFESCEAGFCEPETGNCRARKGPGEECVEDLECDTGVCDDFDAICCNRECDAQEEKCFEGSCVPIDFTPSPSPTRSLTPTPSPTKTVRLTPGPNGLDCAIDSECTSGFCTDGVCCAVAECPDGQFCSPGTGMCSVDPPTPTATATRVFTLPSVNPCGSCPSGTRCNNGSPPLCVRVDSSGGCSTGGEEQAAGNLALAAMLPLTIWLGRRLQLRHARVRSRAPRK